MADPYIVKSWLKFAARLAGVAFCGGLLATWHFWRETAAYGDRSPFLLSAAITGALGVAWMVLFALNLLATPSAYPLKERGGLGERVPWWLLKVLLLALFIGAMGFVLHRYGTLGADEFELLRKDRFDVLGERLDANPELLEKRAGVGRPTLAQAAFRENRPAALGWLLARGADPGELDPDGRNPLVASLGNLPMLATLLDAGLDPDAPAADGLPPIHHAVDRKAVEALALLVRKGGSLEVRDPLYRTPLMRAIEADDLATAESLLDLGAVADGFDQRGDTPLHKAVRRRHLPCAALLLERGADPKRFNFAHLSPLHIAVIAGHDDIARLLLERPELVDLCDETDRTPLDHALEAGRYDAVRLLLEHGADIDRRDGQGDTPLHRTIHARDYRSARFLLGEGARIDLPDARGETALGLMRRRQLQGLLDLVEARENPGPAAPASADAAAEAP